MKSICLFVFLTVYSLNAIGQSNSIPSKSDTSLPKGVILDATSRNDIRPGFTRLYNEEVMNSTVVLLNGKKILRLDDKEFVDLKNEDIQSWKIVEDLDSQIMVKKIIIINTKSIK
jgi:hypothetical protein